MSMSAAKTKESKQAKREGDERSESFGLSRL